jgi:hypothetical protein
LKFRNVGKTPAEKVLLSESVMTTVMEFIVCSFLSSSPLTQKGLKCEKVRRLGCDAYFSYDEQTSDETDKAGKAFVC